MLEQRPRKIGRYILVMAGVMVFIFGVQILPQACKYQPTIKSLTEEQKKSYSDFVTSHRQAPQDFILESFGDHNVVFVGEFQSPISGPTSFRQNVSLILNLIPRLYKQGVTVIGLQHALADDQKEIDALLAAPEYDEEKTKSILSRQYPLFGYQEYADIFKQVWTLNRRLAPYEKPIRIVGLNMKVNLDLIVKDEDSSDPEILKKVFNNTVHENFIFQVINREILQYNAKALLYMSYFLCIKDVANREYQEQYTKMGLEYQGTPAMLVRKQIGDRAMVIFLHNMWIRNESSDLTFPMEGLFDAVMRELPESGRTTGFLVAGSPFANIPITASFVKKGDQPVFLTGLCDAYILNGPLYLYRTPTYMASFINEKNIEDVKKRVGMTGDQAEKMTAEEMIKQVNEQLGRINEYMSNLPH